MIPELLALNGKAVASPAVMLNAVAIAYVPSNAHARNYLLGIDADFAAAVSAIKTVTIKTGPATADSLLNQSTGSRGSTDTEVAFTAFQYVLSRIPYAKAADAVGVALATGTILADDWGIYLFSIDAAGTITSTAGAGNFDGSYADEAAAIAGLPATPTDEDSMFYVTVQTKTGFAFIGGTDALTGGSSGNIANATNYVSTTGIVLTTVGAPARWDFTNGPYYRALPAIIPTVLDQALAVELEASGDGAKSGRVVVYVAAP